MRIEKEWAEIEERRKDQAHLARAPSLLGATPLYALFMRKARSSAAQHETPLGRRAAVVVAAVTAAKA